MSEPTAAEIGLVTAALASAAQTVGLKPYEYAERARQVLVGLAAIRGGEGERYEGYVSPATMRQLDAGQFAAFSPDPVATYTLPATLIVSARRALSAGETDGGGT